MKPKHILYLCTILAIACSVAGFYVGREQGIKRGAWIGASVSKMTLEQQRNLLLAIERNAEIEGPHKDTAIEIIKNGLESYLPQRTLLEAEPFGQEFRNKEATDKEINEAIERLKIWQNEAVDTTAANARLFHNESSNSTNPDVEATTEAAVVSP